MAFNYYLLGLGHDKLAGFIALNAGIVLATVFRFSVLPSLRLGRSAGE